MAAKIYASCVSSCVTHDNETYFIALGLNVIDGETPVDCIFVQTDGLAEKEVGVTEYGGCVLQLTDDNADDELTFVAIPKDEYPDDTHKVTATVTRSTLLTLGAGSEVVDPTP